MRPHVFVSTVVLVVASAQPASAVAQQASEQITRKPNVGLVMMDDLGCGGLGTYGVNNRMIV